MWGCWGQKGTISLPPFRLSLPPDSSLPLFSSSREEGAGVASWAGGQTVPFPPGGAGFPCAGLEEEVINDRGARRGECSGLMLVLIRSWSPATDRIQPGPCVCVCVCVCWEAGCNGRPGAPGSSHQPPSLPIGPPTSLALVFLEVPSAVCPPTSC